VRGPGFNPQNQEIKKLTKAPLNKELMHTYNPSYTGGRDERIIVEKLARPYLKKQVGYISEGM
jgi:hypothetical protein